MTSINIEKINCLLYFNFIVHLILLDFYGTIDILELQIKVTQSQ